jgi:hypothetical protein
MGFGNASDSTNRTDGVPRALNPGAPPKQNDGPSGESSLWQPGTSSQTETMASKTVWVDDAVIATPSWDPLAYVRSSALELVSCCSNLIPAPLRLPTCVLSRLSAW